MLSRMLSFLACSALSCNTYVYAPQNVGNTSVVILLIFSCVYKSVIECRLHLRICQPFRLLYLTNVPRASFTVVFRLLSSSLCACAFTVLFRLLVVYLLSEYASSLWN
ncbi:hypothetical protein BC629DRAFT_553816 [Irpex lacteus]|nr:hypothetical protein BC629DRAFT_553816 [Irpex lacteus]